MLTTFRSLSNPNYRRYAAGGIVSNTGTWLQRVGQDWLVLQLSGNSGTAVGITTALQFLPFVLLAPFAGLIADRLPKRRLLQLTNVAMAVPAFVLGLLAVTGTAQIWHVYLLALVLGVAAVFDAPARQSFVSEIVEPDDLSNAIGLNSASFNAARLVGPGVAGLLVAALGGGASATGWVILLNAVSYAAPILALQRMDPRRLNTPRPPDRRAGMVREGIGYVSSDRRLVFILMVVFSAGAFGLNFQLTSALMAAEVFHVGAAGFGALGSVLAVGSLAGALLAARRRTVTLRLVVVAALAFGLIEVLAALMPTYLSFALLCPLLGFAALTLLTGANTYFQLHTESHMRGRAMALYMMVTLGSTVVGAPLIGWVGEQFGARWTMISGGLLTMGGVALACALNRHLWNTPGRGEVAILTPVGASE